jgi:hypothetical protein
VDIGVHSIRKGSSTYVASGSTQGPSFASICNRAGWTLGGVHERYIKFEGAGDQFVGRTVRGVSLDSPNFSMLPPYFYINDVSTEVISACFPALSNIVNMKAVLRFSLASIVYHRDFVKSCLPANHALFSTTLFRNTELLPQLSSKVKLGIRSNEITSTGIPPYSSLLRQVSELDDLLKSLPTHIVKLVVEALEENGAAAANVTPAALKSTLADILGQLIPSIASSRDDARNINVTETNASSYPIFMWQGKLHRVPEDFNFPKCNVSIAFELWHLGNPEKSYPPFKLLEPSDMSDLKKRKRLSDWKYFMNSIEVALSENADLNRQFLDSVYLRNQLALARERLPSIKKKKRCRTEDWMLLTAVKELRTAIKKQRTITAGEILIAEAATIG